MSLTLVYVGAAAGLVPAVSLRALAGGGASLSQGADDAHGLAASFVHVPCGLDDELVALIGAAVARDRLVELTATDASACDQLARRAATEPVLVALAGPHAARLARDLRRRLAAAGPGAVVTVPAGGAFDDLLLAHDLVSLKRIVDVLRVECPWDREQTPRDIVGYTVEEVYELADAIADGDLTAEHGELGDLLLQVVLLALMLNEEGAGDLGSVAHQIEEKLIRRHPHIFAGAVAHTPAQVKSRWERIKREQEGREGIFHDVPAGFPALLYAKKLQQRAASVGFDWSSAAEAFPKIAEEHAELAELFAEAVSAASTAGEAAGDPSRVDPRVAHEVGDLLFATVNVARLLHVDPELALRETGRRFARRVTAAAAFAASEGCDWAAVDLSLQEDYYQRAKAAEAASAATTDQPRGSHS